MTLRCFVAMAFNREDTDEVYDKLIVPTLRSSNVTPVRVDRIEHQDDIDDRIISEIQKADLVIADLTYARPSVYFEAGFAERGAPVIYTCRQDHFSPKESDVYGNLRVHFDLQMKNIIPWSNPSDEVFAGRLKRRVSKVIAPLVRAKKDQQRRTDEITAFTALPTTDRIRVILDLAVLQMTSAGYRGVVVEKGRSPLSWFDIGYIGGDNFRVALGISKLLDRLRCLEPGWIGMRSKVGVRDVVLVHACPGLTKKRLTLIRDSFVTYPAYDINPSSGPDAVIQMLDNIVACSLRKVPLSRVMDALTDFRLDRNNERFVWSGTQLVPRGTAREAKVYQVDIDSYGSRFLVRHSPDRLDHLRLQPHELAAMPRSIHLYVLDNLRSEEVAEEKLSRVLVAMQAGLG